MNIYSEAQRTEAAEWFVAIREIDDPEPETLQAWLRWLEASEGNRNAFQSVERAWQQTVPSLVLAMPGAQELADDNYDGSMPVAQWHIARAIKPPSAAPEIAGFRHRRGVFVGAMAASVVLAAFFAGPPALDLLHRLSAPQAGEYITATGQHKQIVLADGSRVTLGARSRLAVDFNEQRRLLRLESGEAYFSVRKDSRRPFTVRALNGSITALGTAFNVRRTGDRVTVAVTEGVVSIAGAVDAESGSGVTPAAPDIRESVKPARRVSSGEQLTFGETATPAMTAAAPSSNERVRWREGWLVYRDETLSDVLADVGRYTGRHIELHDAAAGRLRFSGAVHKDDIDEWLFALPESFPIALETDGSRLVVTARAH